MTIILGSICTEFQTVDIEIKSGLKMAKKKLRRAQTLNSDRPGFEDLFFLLTTCMTLERLVNFPKPQLPHVKCISLHYVPMCVVNL